MVRVILCSMGALFIIIGFMATFEIGRKDDPVIGIILTFLAGMLLIVIGKLKF